MGDLRGVLLTKGELDGVSLILPHAGLIIRALDGVSDISHTKEVEEYDN